MDKTTLELRMPSAIGNEKYAMEFAEDVAIEMGFPQGKVENLKIAVSEACLNAIEHGNKQKKNMKVIIDFTISKSGLEINVQDQGKRFIPGSIDKPNLKDIIEGKDKTKRGWGMFMISQMVDEMKYLDVKSGTHLKMVIKLPGQTDGSEG